MVDLATYRRSTDEVQAVQTTMENAAEVAAWLTAEYKRAFGVEEQVTYEEGSDVLLFSRGPSQPETDPVPVPVGSWFVFRGLGNFIMHTPEEFEAMYVAVLGDGEPDVSMESGMADYVTLMRRGLPLDGLVGATITDVNVDLREGDPITDKLDLYVGDRVIRFRTRDTQLGPRLHITERPTDHLAEQRAEAERQAADAKLADETPEYLNPRKPNEGHFLVDSPCPSCGRTDSIFGYYFLNQDGKHQHTHYVCTSWPSPPRGTPPLDPAWAELRCGWHGWSVPDAPRQSDEEISREQIVLLEKALEGPVAHEEIQAAIDHLRSTLPENQS